MDFKAIHFHENRQISRSSFLVNIGLKVVRGPDWTCENEDDGEGHVGTIVEIGTIDGTPDKHVFVVWDGGYRGKYRIGYNNCYDLRVLDNGSIGVHHTSITCDSCRKSPIIGFRWKCKTCYDYDLCTPCYMSDKHDTTHRFTRFQLHRKINVDVPQREGSVKIPLRGILPTAKVVRVLEQNGEKPDGDRREIGIVKKILGGDHLSNWNLCHVSWSINGFLHAYCLGKDGKVDLKYVEDATDGYYYRDHLPILGDETRTVKELETATKVKECSERKSLISFCENFENLYTSGQLCDFTIKVKNREFPIHKAVLAAHSPVFMSMFLHDMKEKINGVVDIPDCEPNVFEDFLFYLYSGKIKIISCSNVTDLYEIAEKYNVLCLKADCSQVMKEAISVDFVCDVLILGLKYLDEELINCATQFFLSNAQEVFVTAKWQTFLIQHPIPANELYIKAFSYRNGKR